MLSFNDRIFEKFPVLETKNLILREITPKDAEVIFRNYSDTEVMKYFGRELFKNISQAEERINAVKEDYNNRKGIRWAVCLKKDNVMIGSGGFWRILKEHLRAEIGYELSKTHWGQGVMKEALNAMISFGFKKMNLHSIEANLDPENAGSVKLLEKLNFVREGYFKDSYYFKGEFTDTASYSLINVNQK